MTDPSGEVRFGLSAGPARRMGAGGFVGLFLGGSCLVSLVIGLTSDDPLPVGGAVAVGVLGVFFLLLGLLLGNGSLIQARRVNTAQEHRIMVGPTGLREFYPSGQVWSVAWDELTGISLAASDAGIGHDPLYPEPVRSLSLDSAVARGDLTLLRLWPKDETQFARDHAFLVDGQGGRMDHLVVSRFGRTLPMDDKERRAFADCLRWFSGPLWGGLWDETQRARVRGPGIGYDG